MRVSCCLRILLLLLLTGIEESPLKSLHLVRERHAMGVKVLAASQDEQYLVSSSTDSMKVINFDERTVMHDIQLEHQASVSVSSAHFCMQSS